MKDFKTVYISNGFILVAYQTIAKLLSYLIDAKNMKNVIGHFHRELYNILVQFTPKPKPFTIFIISYDNVFILISYEQHCQVNLEGDLLFFDDVFREYTSLNKCVRLHTLCFFNRHFEAIFASEHNRRLKWNMVTECRAWD